MKKAEKCERCKKKMYGYSDSVHDIWLCWRCGKFSGTTRIHDDFTELIMMNPLIIIDLIHNGCLKPI